MGFKLKPEYEDSIAALLFIVVASIPMAIPLGIPVEVDPMTMTLYETIENVPDGGIVLYDFTILNWFTNFQADIAILKQLIRRVEADELYLVLMTEGTGPIMGIDKAWNTLKLGELEYGVQWVYLGLIPGGEKAEAAVAADVWAAKERDHYGTPLSDLPLMERFHSIEDLALVCVGMNTSPDPPCRQFGGKGVPLILQNGISTIPLMMPYLEAGIITAYMTPGLQTAGYEKVLGELGLATSFADAQSATVAYAILLIIASNVMYYLRRQKR